MKSYRMKGRASYGGAVQRDFDVVVVSDDSQIRYYASKQAEAVKSAHPDWRDIVVTSCTPL